MPAELGGITPIFCVRDLRASIDYYVRVLGFDLNWDYGDGFASVKRGRCEIFVTTAAQGNSPAWAWVGVDDAEALHRELLARGAKIRHAPTNYSWAYEMQVEDLDGNVLRLGSEPKEDQPFGEWLDMHGVRWLRRGDGWTRITSEALDSPVAQTLIGQLNAELAAQYDDPRANHFRLDEDEVAAERGAFLV